MRASRTAPAVVALAFLPLIAFAQTKIKTGWNLFSPEQDVEIGQQSVKEALKKTPLLKDPEAEKYVNDIGQKLAANAGGPKFQYEFRIVDSHDINAFALPGGFIFVNRGILENAKNDGEVAGVVAHEIAHASLRHGTHQATKAYAAEAGLTILGGLLGGKVGQNTADIINTVGGVGLNTLFLKYSRDLETQADIRGAQIVAATGYSPDDMVNFFRTLEKVDKSKKTSFLADHPAPPDRIARIQREEAVLKVSPSPDRSTAQLAALQTRLHSSSAVASAALKSYTSRSGAYRISYPDGWQLQEEGDTGVTIAPQNGLSGEDVRYGAVLNVYAANGAKVENATDDLISRIRNNNSYLRLVDGSAQRVRLDTGEALQAALRGQNPQSGVDEHVTVVTRPLPDGNLVYLLFITPNSEVASSSGVLDSMIRSMEVATAVR